MSSEQMYKCLMADTSYCSPTALPRLSERLWKAGPFFGTCLHLALLPAVNKTLLGLR